MHFRYFSSLFGLVVLPPSASFRRVCYVSAHYLVTGYSLYLLNFFFSWAQCSHPIYWMLRDRIWSYCTPILGSPPLLWQRCGCGLLSIRDTLKYCALVMLILMLIAALRARVCELVWMLIQVHSFSEIIQITRHAEPLCWRLYTETVSRI